MGFCKALTDTPPLTTETDSRKRYLPVDSDIEKDSHDLYMPQKKRVRFATSGWSGAVKTTEASSDILHSDLDKTKLWWSRQERAGIIDRCHAAIKDFRRDNMDQVRHYLSVFEQCSQNPSQSSSEYLEKATVSLPVHIRGLEWGIAPTTKTHRRAHAQEVLDTQDQIQGLSSAMRDRVLSGRAFRSSRRCRVMARLLGDCDANSRQEGSKGKQRRSQCKMMPNW
jgi:hypothetical protein